MPAFSLRDLRPLAPFAHLLSPREYAVAKATYSQNGPSYSNTGPNQPVAIAVSAVVGGMGLIAILWVVIIRIRDRRMKEGEAEAEAKMSAVARSAATSVSGHDTPKRGGE
ncbi:hypothetical protein MCOR02_004450 [Pyricularia oryzae]|uniref:Uncharacterized protein n=1 Tax=Pyricularia oryzae TaxID=318829 RepID=A0A4P7N2Q4_PYROR|nr:hypothetical protein MCOR02_004450 [Pyricularia oryzae]KAI6293851.1 hypothetical protein MCOR34_009814 [Pyricularia oryzae]KAI6471558.1 hypothetical protein MCOR17_003158 [Pyricularia oryzae]KAI6482924.1 hypothetical protein MCOR13_010362 [Pyricularia oryzae]KAI6568011.1 hypothetical protein MCOR04_008528 [Pyricularia oryzae]